MKLLEEIPTFPEAARKTLESRFGIESAEAFYASASSDAQGMTTALGIEPTELSRLMRTVEGYLSPAYIERCHRPATKRPRGVILD